MNLAATVPNRSPWLAELNRQREVVTLEKNTKSDVAIVGGGIAGVMTAYFLLTETKKKVILIEAGKLAHGATGHNAGQMVNGFEKGFKSLVESYGLSLATRAQEDILKAWDLLECIQKKAGLQTPVHTFTGYTGFTELEDLLEHLENRYWLKQGGLAMESVLIASNFKYLESLPKHFNDLYATVPQGKILELLQTNNEEYMALSMSKAGVTNSARLTEELAQFLLKTYADRFEIFEQSPVKIVHLKENAGEVISEKGHSVRAKYIVLCTNGFEKLHIQDDTGPDIDTSFHSLIDGLVGYMAGFYEPSGKNPMAVSYHGSPTLMLKTETEIPPYFYFTRRPYTKEKNLMCLGGPEYLIPNRHDYDRATHVYPEAAKAAMDRFLRHNYIGTGHPIDYAYFWHGLMGYTPSGLRCVGPDLRNPVLMYNIGCNGVGILSSITGSQRIADHFKYEKLEPSLFDPVYSGRGAKNPSLS